MDLLLRGAEGGQGKQRGGRGKGKERGGKGAGVFKGTPGLSECVTEILGKNKEVGRPGRGGGGAKFKFGQLIPRKIIKTVTTRCHMLRLKYTKFNFGWGSAPDPAGEANSAPPDPLAGFKRSYL